jgi:nitroreductase
MFDISGMDAGVWYYHPQRNAWAVLYAGHYRKATQAALRNDDRLAGASAICVLAANLRLIAEHAGPDLYRLAYLEAGIVSQRLHLSAYSSGLAAVCTLDFDDEAVRVLLGIDQTGWQPLCLVAIGASSSNVAAVKSQEDAEDGDIWRG